MSLGTTGVSIAVMHQHADETPEILAFHRVNARFLRNGMIVNLEALQDAVSECRKNIASLIRTPFHHTTSQSLRFGVSYCKSGQHPSNSNGRRKSTENICRSSHLSKMFIEDPEWRLVHVFPSSYDVDNQTFLTSPVGMLGKTTFCASSASFCSIDGHLRDSSRDESMWDTDLAYRHRSSRIIRVTGYGR